jgi:hypothetical protein
VNGLIAALQSPQPGQPQRGSQPKVPTNGLAQDAVTR